MLNVTIEFMDNGTEELFSTHRTDSFVEAKERAMKKHFGSNVSFLMDNSVPYDETRLIGNLVKYVPNYSSLSIGRRIKIKIE